MLRNIFKFVLVFSLFSFVLVSKTNAQLPFEKGSKNYKNSIENIKTGLRSDNLGLRKSSIYFAGKYKLKEVTEDLVKLFKEEDDPGNKVLIALSLYMVGDIDALEEVRRLSFTEKKDKYVRNMIQKIYFEYLVNENERFVLFFNK